jgi:hypothetical protein
LRQAKRPVCSRGRRPGETKQKEGRNRLDIYSYALFSFGLTAVISLLLIAVIVGINTVMHKLNIQDDVEE